MGKAREQKCELTETAEVTLVKAREQKCELTASKFGSASAGPEVSVGGRSVAAAN